MCGVIILTGAGRAFCAGLNLDAATSGQGVESNAISSGHLDLKNTPPTILFNMDTPTICAINGGAAGYGMDTALGCDIRVMSDKAKDGSGLYQARRCTGIRRHLVPAAPSGLGESRSAHLYRTDAHRS